MVAPLTPVLAEPWHLLPSCPREGARLGLLQTPGCRRALQASWGGSPTLPTTPCPPHALSPPLKWGEWGRLPSGPRARGQLLQTDCGDTSCGQEPGGQL